jgi:hypothetical protein
MRPVPQYDAKNWLLKALRETSHAMESLLWDLDERLLHEQGVGEEWGAAELLRHMAAMERRQGDRLEAMVRLDAPRIRAFDADSIDAEGRPEDNCGGPWEALEEFGSLRQQSVYLLWSLDDADWGRKGIHPYLGPLTVLQVAREINEHDLAHLWQLRRLCDSLSTASV